MTTLPEEFVKSVCSLPGLEGLEEALSSTAASTGVRLNPAKRVEPEPFAGESRSVAWCAEGRRLDSRPQFTFDPLMHQGAYYVQDPSSMIMAHVAARIAAAEGGRPLAWLDACAAPGGKTTAAMSALPEGSVVVANEYSPQRSAVLRENLAKWGYGRAVVTTGDTARFRKTREAFDVIAADVPCSGEGMMRKDATAVEQWSPRLVEECVARQWEIIGNLWGALKPGGWLIYSTCTFNRREDEEMVERIIDELGAEAVDLRPEGSEEIAGAIGSTLPAMRFIPGRVEGEGLFMAILRKPADDSLAAAAPRKNKKERRERGWKKEQPWMAEARSWLLNPDDYTLRLVEEKGVVEAVPSSELLPREIAGECRPVLTIATLKGRDLVPAQPLALSSELRPDAFARVEVERSTALDYLRREAVSLPEGTPRGIVLLTHRGLPLGFVKNLGNRANNLYPAPWRILSQQKPEE